MYEVALELAIGLVFLLAAGSKLRHPIRFSTGVGVYVPWANAPGRIGVASALALCESFIAVSHLTGWWLEGGVLTGLGLLCGLATIVGWALAKGRAVPCLCFGGSSESLSSRHFLRVLLLLCGEAVVAAAMLLEATPPRPWDLDAVGFASSVCLGLLLILSGSWLVSVPTLMGVLRGRYRVASRSAMRMDGVEP
jgi:Methylamine utilisation protein MauE